jgi:hypothetical protein
MYPYLLKYTSFFTTNRLIYPELHQFLNLDAEEPDSLQPCHIPAVLFDTAPI